MIEKYFPSGSNYRNNKGKLFLKKTKDNRIIYIQHNAFIGE